MANCTISGTVKTAAGAAVQYALVRMRLLLAPVSSGAIALQTAPVETWTAADGTFSLSALQGATARIEIPSCQTDVYGTIPATSTATLETILGAWEEWEP